MSGRVRRFAKTRSDAVSIIESALNTKDAVYWLHGASVGEIDQALAIARELRHRNYRAKILITAFSLSVQRLPKDDCDYCCYLPLDFPWAWNFMKPKPNLTFITFTWDIYPNLLRRIRQAGGRSFLCSAALPADSWRIRYARWVRSSYQDLTGIGVVDEPNKRHFKALAASHTQIEVTGDSRYDTIFFKLEQASLSSNDAQKLKKAQPLFILASTYKQCDDQLFPHLRQWLVDNQNFDVWIFPHHVDDSRIKECQTGLEEHGIDFQLYSKQKDPGRVVLVDQIGLLANVYARAVYAYVGGGFHHRIHNTAEPAALGAVVLTGPHIETSPIALQLEEQGTLFRRNDGADLFDVLTMLAANDDKRNELSKKNRQYLKEERGAAGRFIDTFLPPP